MKDYTLAFPIRNSHILLGMKKRSFGMGKWNGFGGKVHQGENILCAAQRELHEECGIAGGEWFHHASIMNYFPDVPDRMVHIYAVKNFMNEPQETDEMRPEWFNLNDIPYAEMWESDRHWLPFLIEGKKFEGSVRFDENFNMIENTFSVIP